MKHLAYVTAEIGLSTAIPTYSGGLGVLAGDHVKAAADLGLPLVGVTLFYKKGYGIQSVDTEDQQKLLFPLCDPGDVLEDTGHILKLGLEGEVVRIKVWRRWVRGRRGHGCPVLFLDTDIDGNSPVWRPVSNLLYGGDNLNRLRQEAVLGVGGYAAVKACGYGADLFAHLNEGHTALFAAAMCAELGSVAETKKRVHFTTHTPVPAGFDRFDHKDVERVLGDLIDPKIAQLGGSETLNMAWLAASLAGHVNGVSEINARVAQPLFSAKHFDTLKVEAVTNGVHFDTWVSPQMGALYDQHLFGWRDDPALLDNITGVDPEAFDRARRRAKRELLEYANGQTQLGFDPEVLTFGFARRMAAYKRATLIFRDLDRLLDIGRGRVQILFAGKAHEKDAEGKALVHELLTLSHKLRGELRIGFLSNYNMWLGHMLTSGVDVWLNNPVRPLEACGTSGMKASLNGVPNCSILDGWWAEGCIDGHNGWAIGQDWETRDDGRDAQALYDTLEKRVIACYYGDRAKFRRIQMGAVAVAPRFSARRMVLDYSVKYYGWQHARAHLPHADGQSGAYLVA
ncbi:MAG: alpha-glucan family phosphorylase [Deltaproteobacteria bacterium]|nr:alpha-glucan family phosphorylase [Deltaproteobacteria bacterium]